MTYKNPDPGVEKDAIGIANEIAAYFENEMKRIIDNKYYRKSWTVLSTELRLKAIEEIRKKFFAKLAEMKRAEGFNAYKYKAQDKTYPKSKLKEDLKNWI